MNERHMEVIDVHHLRRSGIGLLSGVELAEGQKKFKQNKSKIVQIETFLEILR